MSSQPPRLSSAQDMPAGAGVSKLAIALVILVVLLLLALLVVGAVVLGDKALEALNLCWGDCG